MSIFQSQLVPLQEQIYEQKMSGNGGVNYGNMIVFSASKIHISLGPDYPFTIVALVFLSIISYALYLFQSILDFGVLGRAINVLFVFFPPVSFLYTALSNPGVYNSYENDQAKTKYCQMCGVFKPSRVYHCERCNVCIQGHDHHCIWLSKCVGRKNLVAFYLFIISVPSSFLYFAYLIYTAISMQKRHAT